MKKYTSLISAIQRYGMIYTIKNLLWIFPFILLDYLEGFDKKYGSETSGILDTIDLGYKFDKLSEANLNLYQPTLSRSFVPLINSIKINHADFTFIDIGSGKGRAQLYASNFPFKKIIGIELSKNLSLIALNNLKLYQSNTQKCFDITVVNEDATHFKFPKGNMILYMYNPFTAEIVKDFLNNLMANLSSAEPRIIYILYSNPLHARVIQSFGFKLVAEQSTKYSFTTAWKCYVNN